MEYAPHTSGYAQRSQVRPRSRRIPKVGPTQEESTPNIHAGQLTFIDFWNFGQDLGFWTMGGQKSLFALNEFACGSWICELSNGP